LKHLYLLLWIPIGLAGCANRPEPVDHPCGVITDSLQNVNATSRVGQERLDVHFERGERAGCWKRVGHLPVLADAPKAHPHVRKPKAHPAPVSVKPEPVPAPIVEPAPTPAPEPAPPPLDETFMGKVRAHLNSGVKW
jgi:hypothetical protein